MCAWGGGRVACNPIRLSRNRFGVRKYSKFLWDLVTVRACIRSHQTTNSRQDAATSQLILTIRSTIKVQLEGHSFTVVFIEYKFSQLGLFGACRLRNLTSKWLMFKNPCQTLMVSFFQYKCMFLTAKKLAKPLVVVRQLTILNVPISHDCGLSFRYRCATYQFLLWIGWRWSSSHDRTRRRFRLPYLRRLRPIEALFIWRFRDRWLIETQNWPIFF